MGDIVVTAQKREQRLQDVPVAITAVGQEALTANRIVSVRDLDSAVPNLTVRTQAGGSSLPLYTMRGVVALGSAQGSDKGVAVYIDGVYQGSASGSIIELAEIERIEVLRGPQGTLFGRNSTGGAISFITPEPTGELGVRQTLSLGNYDQFRSTTRLNTPDWNGLSAAFTYVHSERRGDIENLGAGAVWDFTGANGGKPFALTSPKWLGSSNVESMSAAVRYEPTDGLKLLYRFDYTENDYTSPGFGSLYLSPTVEAIYAAQPDQSILTPITRERPDAVNAAATTPSRNKSFGHSLTVEYQVSDNVSLKNILAYRKSRYRGPWQETSGTGGLINTGAPIFNALLGQALAQSTIGAPFIVMATTSEGGDRQWSNELQLIADTDFVTLTTGALYYDQTQWKGPFGVESGIGRARSGTFRVYPGYQVPFAGQIGGTQGRATTFDIRSIAAYAYGEFHVTPQLDLVAGIRYTNDKKTGTDYSIYAPPAFLTYELDYSDDQVTYNLGANYKVNSDVLLYAKYSTGYISGGQLAGIPYAPEKAKSWEAGIKADWFGRTLRTNLALFHVDYENLQTSGNGTALTPPRPEITQLLTNFGNARARGFELETIVNPVEGLTFSGGVGYTDFKFKELSAWMLQNNVKVLKQYRPDWTINLAAQYQTAPLFDDVTLTARVDGNWKSKSTGLTGVPRSVVPSEHALYEATGVADAYWLLNGRIALQGFNLGGANGTVALWGRNLLDAKNVQYVFGVVLATAADYERARTFGVDLTFEF